jgi:hypothetical protein
MSGGPQAVPYALPREDFFGFGILLMPETIPRTLEAFLDIDLPGFYPAVYPWRSAFRARITLDCLSRPRHLTSRPEP